MNLSTLFSAFHSESLYVSLVVSLVSFFSECATTLTDDFGVVTSPNFPQKYENNIDCTWLIELSVEKFIKIEFLSFDLEHHYNCMLVLPSSLFQLELVKGQF